MLNMKNLFNLAHNIRMFHYSEDSLCSPQILFEDSTNLQHTNRSTPSSLAVFPEDPSLVTHSGVAQLSALAVKLNSTLILIS